MPRLALLVTLIIAAHAPVACVPSRDAPPTRPPPTHIGIADTGVEEPDASAHDDAGAHEDAGAREDAAVAEDASVGRDAAPAEDAAAPADSGPRPDAGHPTGTFPTSIRLFVIGHSLTSDIPDMIMGMAQGSGVQLTFRYQDIPGSPLRYHWSDGGGSRPFEPTYGGNYTTHLPSGQFDHLLMVDGVPRGGTDLVNEGIDYATRFANYAQQHRADVRTFYYEPWHCLTSGTPTGCMYDNTSPTRSLTWRARLEADQAMWRGIVNEVNRRKNGGPPMRLVPAATALMHLYDDMIAGQVPGIQTIQDLFSDDIHPNSYARYLVACVHYAVLYGRTPVGLPFEIRDRWGWGYWTNMEPNRSEYPPPSPALVTYLQELAWRVALAEPLTGLGSN